MTLCPPPPPARYGRMNRCLYGCLPNSAKEMSKKVLEARSDIHTLTADTYRAYRKLFSDRGAKTYGKGNGDGSGNASGGSWSGSSGWSAYYGSDMMEEGGGGDAYDEEARRSPLRGLGLPCRLPPSPRRHASVASRPSSPLLPPEHRPVSPVPSIASSGAYLAIHGAGGGRGTTQRQQLSRPSSLARCSDGGGGNGGDGAVTTVFLEDPDAGAFDNPPYPADGAAAAEAAAAAIVQRSMLKEEKTFVSATGVCEVRRALWSRRDDRFLWSCLSSLLLAGRAA